MIIIFLILTFLRTLQGAPIPNPTSPDVDTLLIRDGTTGGSDGTNIRTRYELVRSCILTVLACVWSAAHPNIPGPTDSGWTILKRRLTTTICALIAPEMMAYWALRQWVAATRIADDYNTTVLMIPRSELLPLKQRIQNGLGEAVRQFLYKLPKDRAMRQTGQTWSSTHGFFVQMGGFLLYEDNKPKRVLKYHDIKNLIQNGSIDAPIYTISDLQDRSKGNAISKGFVVLQTTWFVMQCITRISSHLPLTELEVVTLGFAILNGVIYAVWWNKPQGVKNAILIPLKAKEPHVASGDAPATPEAVINKSWLRRQIEKDWSKHKKLRVLALVVELMRWVEFILLPLSKLGGRPSTPADGNRVPMFYADDERHGRTAGYVSCMIGVVFGVVHLLAWASNFQSFIELFLWRGSTLIIIAVPVWMIMMRALSDHKSTRLGRKLRFNELADFIAITCLYIALPYYIAARFTLLTLAFASLRAQVPKAFETIPWTSYIPHL